jgi:hypothetical protein
MILIYYIFVGYFKGKLICLTAYFKLSNSQTIWSKTFKYGNSLA